MRTRALLWRGTSILGEARTPVGVRDAAIAGSNEVVARAVAGTMAGVCLKAGIAPEAVDIAVASGMITSGLGLKEIPHVVAPAGIADLAEAMSFDSFPGVWLKPIWFIPGVRNKSGPANGDALPQMDMVRGQEVRAIALTERLGIQGACWLALPGAHAKFIRLSKNGRIAQIVSTLTGEMMDALSRHTILAAAVDPGCPINPEWLLKGCRLSMEQGLSRAIYCVRLAQVCCDGTVADRTSYLLGALLGSDMLTLKAAGADRETVYVGGSDDLRDAYVTLMHSDGGFKEVIPVDTRLLDNLSGWGAMLVARHRGLISDRAD
jgi:2-dehydro-3-deoxygalactonokinase